MATLGQINAQGGKYFTPEAINRALAAGAGDGPGQQHVDDWLQNNFSPDDNGDASSLLGGPLRYQANYNADIMPWEINSGGEMTGQHKYDPTLDQGVTAMNQQLAQAKRFDPNAHITYGEDGMPQEVVYDQSKIPKPTFDPKYAGNGLTSLYANNAGGRVKDPSQIINDPHYGAYTATSNLSQAGNDSFGGGIGQLGKYMPSVIGATMSMASGGLMSPQLVQAVAGATSGQGVGNLTKLLANLAGSYALGQVPGLAAAAGFNGLNTGMDTIMPWINKGMTAYQLANQATQAAKGNTGAQVGAGFTLGKLFNQYGLNGGGG